MTLGSQPGSQPQPQPQPRSRSRSGSRLRAWSGATFTRQTVTSLVAAGCVVALAALLAVLPVPYVTWSPGRALDTLGEFDGAPVVRVDGTPTYPTAGRLDLTVVGVTRPDAHLGLPQALLAHWRPRHDALPRAAIYPPGTSDEQAQREEVQQMDTAQDQAVVAALRQAGRPVVEHPAVASVITGGPADQSLRPGDLILAVDGRPVDTPAAVSSAVQRHRVGEAVIFAILRDRARTRVRVTTAALPAAAGKAAVGITVGPGYAYRPTISFDLGRRIGGPSAGLVFAVAVYDKITPGALLEGRHVAGTGTITAAGEVGGIGGIQEKIAGADAAGAETFLVPAANCGDLAGLHTDLSLIRVATLAAAVNALTTLSDPTLSDPDRAAALPRCP